MDLVEITASELAYSEKMQKLRDEVDAAIKEITENNPKKEEVATMKATAMKAKKWLEGEKAVLEATITLPLLEIKKTMDAVKRLNDACLKSVREADLNERLQTFNYAKISLEEFAKTEKGKEVLPEGVKETDVYAALGVPDGVLERVPLEPKKNAELYENIVKKRTMTYTIILGEHARELPQGATKEDIAFLFAQINVVIDNYFSNKGKNE